MRSPLASSKRSASCGSRTKARTTRMPVICSRITRLIWSMRSCISWKAGTISATITPRMTAAAGMATARITERPGSSRTAMTMPTTIVIGAPIAIVQVITTSICTCWTSLVMRVISDGAPNAPDLACREVGDLVEEARPEVAPEAHRDLRTEVHSGRRTRPLHERDEEHQRALALDEAHVAHQHALVDDVGVQRGQEQRGGGRHGLEQHHDAEELSVGPKLPAEEADQHQRAPAPCRNSSTTRRGGSGSSMRLGWVRPMVSPRSSCAASAGGTAR